jgi:hypothetical protein
MFTSLKSLRHLLAPVLAVLMLCGCEKSTVSVSVHGVNYTADEFSYLLIDPDQPDSSSAGEHIDPFAAGGTTCCYVLPKQWKPGIKVKIQTIHWLTKDRDRNFPEVKEEHVVDVPPYVDDKPGELWVLRTADGSVSVISSDFQPDHPKWPGKVKGWPVPSLEYRRERWAIIKDHQEAFVHTFESLLKELKTAPHVRSKTAWEHAQQYDRSSLRGFHGPDDPAYLLALEKRYKVGLEESRAELKSVIEGRP